MPPMRSSPGPNEIPGAFSRRALDADALRAVEHLQSQGFTSYFVGGCVRDLILGRRPKDFDIVTSATPTQIKRVFRNCRLIGRRFRLAHLYYGSKIIEAATFRGTGAADGLARSEDSTSIERTNTFGTPEEDAWSRDFTVNGLFYDPVEQRIIDYVGGYEDVLRKELRTIGDPDERFAEDPVRILRAVKFSSRLGLRLGDEIHASMTSHAHLISTCPPPRVTEEVFRIAESRHLGKALRLMQRTGVLAVILPEISAYLQDGTDSRTAAYFQLIEILDRMGVAHDGVPREFLLTCLYYPLVRAEACTRGTERASWEAIAEELFQPIGVRMHVPVRMRLRLAAVMRLAQRFLEDPPGSKRRKGKALLVNPATPQALSLLRVHYRLTGEGAETYDEWFSLAKNHGIPSSPESHFSDDAPEERGAAPAPSRKPRPRRRNRRGGHGPAAP